MNRQRFLTNLQHPVTIAFLIALVVAFIIIVATSMGSLLNASFLLVLVVLYLACLRLISYNELGDFHRFSLWVIVFAFFLNSWYELLQSQLYTNWTTNHYMVIIIITFVAASTDAVISWALFIIATLIRKGRWDWNKPWDWKVASFIIVLALLGQTLGEVFALRTGRWSYGPIMPTLPILGVGLTPLLQIPLTILISFWLAQRATCRLPRSEAQEVRI
jgi:hypothetical protein